MSEEAQCEHELYGERCRLIKGHSGLHDREFGLVPAEHAPEPSPSGAADEVKECFTCEGENGLPATTAVFICNACAGEERALAAQKEDLTKYADEDALIEQCAVEAAIAETGNLHYQCKSATAIRKLKGKSALAAQKEAPDAEERELRERIALEVEDWQKWYSEKFTFLQQIPDSWSAEVMRVMLPRIADSIRTPRSASQTKEGKC